MSFVRAIGCSSSSRAVGRDARLPLVQRRLSPGKDVGNLEVTRLINRRTRCWSTCARPRNTRRPLPNAIHIPLSQLKSRGDELARLVDHRSSRTT